MRILPLSYEMYEQNSEYRFFSKITKCSNLLFRELFSGHPFSETLHDYFQLSEDLKLKYDILLEDSIVNNIFDFVELYTFAEYIEKQTDQTIYLFARNDLFTKTILHDQKKKTGTRIENACGIGISFLFESMTIVTNYLLKLFVILRDKTKNINHTKPVD
jgi:hypothetical protein